MAAHSRRTTERRLLECEQLKDRSEVNHHERRDMARTSTSSSRTGGRTAGKTAARRTSSKRSKTDVLSILQDDHKRVQKLFKQFEKADRDDSEAMREIAEQACAELEMHAALEEELFYPALREAIDEEEMELMEEARVEHDTAKQLIAQLRELQPGDARYAATFTVLGEYVMHHVEEEESDIFKQAKKAKLDLEALGEQLQERRAQMQGGMDSGGMQAEGGNGESGEAPHEIPVKDMDIEDEEDMEPARPRSGSRGRGARGAR
jgi:hemerythrin-like domain-containing protein